ncbi:MAG: hypothetical protein H6851_17205 [Geminicoccaceae bacterium]|nr:hypothetical protein [Geminicoccaceae bacterium]
MRGVDLEVASPDELGQAALAWRPDLFEALGASTTSAFADTTPGLLLEDLGPEAYVSATGELNPALRRQEGRQSAEKRAAIDAYARRQGPAAMSEEDWKASPYFREDLPFDPFMTQERAEECAAAHDLRRWRDYVIEKRDAGLAESVLHFGAGLVGSLPDPVNFIPMVGPAWRAAWVAKAVTRGAMIARTAAVGALEGAVGTAAMEPFILQRKSYLGDDASFAEVLLDIGMGAALGGAVGAGGAWWSSRGGRSWKPAVNERTGDIDVERVDPLGDLGGRRPGMPDPEDVAAAVADLDTAIADVATGPSGRHPQAASPGRRVVDHAGAEPCHGRAGGRAGSRRQGRCSGGDVPSGHWHDLVRLWQPWRPGQGLQPGLRPLAYPRQAGLGG